MGKLDNKAKKCIYIGLKYGMKVFKPWNLINKKTIQSRDFVFREAKYVPRHEVTVMEKEPEKIEFELEDEESNSIEEAESEEEEPHTLVLRRSYQEIRQPKRYSPPDFCSHFSMSITDDDPRNVKEAVNSEDNDL